MQNWFGVGGEAGCAAWNRTARGTKLLHSLADLLLMLQTHLPDGRGLNSPWQGWWGSFVGDAGGLTDAAGNVNVVHVG